MKFLTFRENYNIGTILMDLKFKNSFLFEILI